MYRVRWNAHQGHTHYAWLKLKARRRQMFSVSKPRLNNLDIRSAQTSQLSSGHSFPRIHLYPTLDSQRSPLSNASGGVDIELNL